MTRPSARLETLLAEHLAAELDDRETAAALARQLAETLLTWRAPTVPLQQVRTIIGFTFGNRMAPSGNRQPGPVNQALADLAVRLHAATGARVWAQWEVAEAIGARLGGAALEAVHPGRDAQAEPRFLSTAGVIEAVVSRGGGAAALGTVAVVAVRDHAWRCVDLCRRHGLQAGVPEGFALPERYDPDSGQPWTRDRLAYLLHDLHCRALDRRDTLVAAPDQALSPPAALR
jgi:hypothetical protein